MTVLDELLGRELARTEKQLDERIEEWQDHARRTKELQDEVAELRDRKNELLGEIDQRSARNPS